MRKKLFTFLLALVTSVGLMWAEPVTVVFEANNNQKEVVVTLPHTFACDFQNGQGELDGIIQELYALQYGGYCQAFTAPTATGNAAVTASKDGNNHYIAISEAFEGTATVTGNYIKFLDTEQQGNTPVDYTLTISVQGSTPSGDEGKLSGAFAINGDGDYIAFSKGNLQYHCTNHVWQFATNQYDIIGNGNANISDSYDGWVDLFGYGTGNNPTLVNTSYSAFSTFTDWGVNAISNGGNEANLWRTLTRDEWAYLFNSRANASSKYGMATVANVPGVIVLPDVYEGSAINTDHNGWGNNIISSGDWAAYETAGAVFLPVAGYREGTTVDNLGSYGFYWSSTPEDAMFSKKLSLDQYLVEPEGYGLRYQGLSVRLVQATSAPSSGSEPEPTEDAIVIVTKTQQSSYTQSTVTISCAAIGDSDGFSVSIYGDKTATITNSDASKIISKIELVPGYSESYHSYVRANGGTPASSSESLITFTNVNSNNVTLSITNEYIQIKEVRITLADNGGSTPAVDPTPTPSATSGIFAYNYDCSRWPAYPTKNNSCQLSGFNAPCVGLNGIDCNIGNVSQGPWKVEFYEMYDDDHVSTYGSIYGVRADAYGILTEYYGSSAVPEYYTDQSAFAAYAHEKLPVYSLSQWNGNAYQVVGYGFICAYAGEGNIVEHAALFIEAGNDYGCFLSGHEHSGSLELTFDYDLKDDMTSFFADGGGSEPATGLQVVEVTSDIYNGWNSNGNTFSVNPLPGFQAVTFDEAKAWTEVPTSGTAVLVYRTNGDYARVIQFFDGDIMGDYDLETSFNQMYENITIFGNRIFYTAGGGSTPAVDPAVQNVIDLINAIPNPVVYTQECYNALDAVYEAYRVLSPEQRDQVTNYDDYLAAEERYYMLGSVNNVIETINDIGNVEFTSECKHRIDYARSEYCNLTLEAKGYVTNYNTLLAAEAAYAALIPVSSTVEWDEAILETIDADEWGEATYTNGSLSLKAVDGRAHYVDIDDHFIFDGSNSEKSFVFSCTSANILRIEITVSEKHEHNELSCAWQETATGYRWVGEATSVDFASTVFKVTEIRFYLGEAFPEPTPTPAQDGDKLPGAFTVDGGKVVYFSKGNLQYLGNIDRWHFAENQWTIIGNAQASDNRDLFSWGTGDNPDSEDYSTYTEWGNNIEGNWRTLTVEEWTYLFNTRTDASSKYGTATVAGVVGLILLPDNYDGTAINTERTAWDNNVISGSEWAAYEAEGAVFLPAAGMSDAYGVYGVGEQGLYWSSTMDALSYQSINVFYGFNPFEGYWFNDVDAQSQPQERLSVRLVSETAPTPAPTPVTSYVVEFALGDAEGTAPTTVDVTIGEDITMPVNKTMYKAGYTLTGWSDGVNTYPIGQPFTPANDVVLTPVFTANQADLLNASSDVTVKWYFGGDNGAPTTSYEGTSGLLVAQATIGDKTVDVKLAIDATEGRFAPQPDTEWANVKVGTIFTYPYKEGITVNVPTYSGNVTYYVADAEGKVACGVNDYYSFIEVTYPASTPTTAVVIGDPNNASQVETFLTTYDGQTIDELIIDRPVYNNMYNTLCLPFDMNAAQIAASSLNGVEIREFTGASVEGTTLNLSVGDPVNAVVAGRPYFVKYSAASQLNDLHFEDVTINNALLDNMAVTFDGVTFKGTFTPFVMQNGLNFQGGYLFLGQNNQLFWPNTPNPLKPFRAYFYVNVESSTQGNAPKYRGMPARIVEGKNVATGVENAQSANQSTKVIVNGQLIIIKNDVRYNAQGQIVK